MEGLRIVSAELPRPHPRGCKCKWHTQRRVARLRRTLRYDIEYPIRMLKTAEELNGLHLAMQAYVDNVLARRKKP
jgi:hypothetical protein